MNQVRDRRAAATLPVRLLLLACWIAFAAFLFAHHVVWRDEVRALSFALSGDTVGDMLGILHGEGHPALWYLTLRGAHWLVPVPQILVVTGFAIGVAAAALFALRAPFGWPMLALALFGRFFLYEYTVVARNYGIATLLLYALAACYRLYRDGGRWGGWLPGALLFLLCNSNIPAIMPAAAFLLFWLLDLHGDGPPTWRGVAGARWRGFALACTMALAGVIACAAEVYPPFNDAAPQKLWRGSVALTLLRMVPLIGRYDENLMPRFAENAAVFVLPLLIYPCLLGWWRTRAGIAAVAGVIAMLAVSALVYKGYYRHQAMIFPFLLTIAWLHADGFGRRWFGAAPPEADRRTQALRTIGRIAFILLLGIQVVWSVPYVSRAIRGMPESRSAELGRLLKRPDLAGAIIIGDPDFKVETVPYYADNPTCFVREQRCGRWSIFSKAAIREISPDTVLDFAERLHAESGRRIVILISEQMFRDGQTGYQTRGTYGPIRITPASLARFRARTRLIASYDHISDGDESYDVYVYG